MYFPDVEAILLAWHERQIAGHLDELADIRTRLDPPASGLRRCWRPYARIAHESHARHDSELAAFLHRDDQVAGAQQQVRDMLGDLLAQVAATGEVRKDVPPEELAGYCLHALSAARSLPSPAAVHRLVTVTLAGLRPQG